MCLMLSKEKLNCLDFIFNFMVVTKFSNVGVSSEHLSMDGKPAMHRMGNIVKTITNPNEVELESVLFDMALIAARSADDAMLSKITIKRDAKMESLILLPNVQRALSFF